jgi:hypothetical protein
LAPPSNHQVAISQSTWRALFCGCALLLTAVSAPLAAAPQQAPAPPPVSLDRIKEELGKTGQGLNLDVPIPPPRPTFKSGVEQRQFVLTLEQALHRDFDLNELQRQSANWASKCCGYDLSQIAKAIDKAVTRRKIRKTREQIWRELAELEAARAAQASAAVVK